MPKKSLLILGSYGQANFGDEVILRVLLEHLPRNKYRIVVNSSFLEVTKRQYPDISVIPTAFWKGLWAKCRHFCSASALIFGGGSILIEHQRVWYNYYRFGTLLRLLFVEIVSVLAGKKVIWFCVGAGPLRSRLGTLLARCCIRFADRIIVRDTLSLELIHSLAPFKPLHLGADPSVLFQPQGPSAQDTLSASLPSMPRPLVCITPQWWVADSVHKTTDLIKELAEYATYVVSRLRGSVLLLSLQNTGPNDDLWVSRKIRDRVPHPSIYLLETELEPHDLLTIFEHADLVVGLRLHALIFTLLAGRPMIALDYEPKVKGFTLEIGYERYLVELGPGFAKQLIALTEELLSRSKTDASAGIGAPALLRLQERARAAFAELNAYL